MVLELGRSLSGKSLIEAKPTSAVTRSSAERFANKQRIRAGLGYRRSFRWRFEFRVKRVF